MKILNLYCGIGGNRKLWGDEHQITAVEIDKNIAKIYQDFFPEDKVVIDDAHEYLLNHFKEFDFIWVSPPCQTHSRMRFKAYCNGKGKPLYPDMKLWQEIIFLRIYATGLWVVENVKSVYKSLINTQSIGRHYIWSNFKISDYKCNSKSTGNNKGMTLNVKMNEKGFKINKWYSYKGDKRTLLNNCVEPELGLHIFKEAFKVKQNGGWFFIAQRREPNSD